MPEAQAPAEQTADQTPEQTAVVLLQLVTDLCRELRGGAQAPRVQIDSDFDRDLGLDSLARAELIQRAETRFAVALPTETMAEIQTPRDLLDRVLQARGAPAAERSGALIRAIALQPVASTPDQATTLPAVLDWHLSQHPERPHLYVYESAERVVAVSYRQLHDRARAMAAGLIRRGIAPGDRVALMLPTSCDYFYLFFAILLARAVPVPIYPPARAAQIEDHLSRHARILCNAGARLLVTVAPAKPLSQLLRLQVPSLEAIVLPGELVQVDSEDMVTPSVGLAAADDIAFLQYTSGSTGVPKGVTLSHANLLANIRAMGQAVQADSRDVMVSWLPVYHDMGLIGAWFGSLYFAIPLVIMSPLLFLARPERWLWAIHRHRGTLSPAPNFAYELCLNKIDESALAGLDLSCWRLALNGAEPVSPRTLARFAERFGRYGFRPESMAPVYGLAESSVGLAFPPLGRVPRIDTIAREPMVLCGRAEPVADGADQAFEVMQTIGLGHPLAGHQLRIVDEHGRELPDRREGRVEFQGPSATSGYFNDPERTRALFDGDWLDTGDRGYLVGGELFITGRSKDMIIRGGRNIYPYELEQAVNELDGVRRGSVAAFAVEDPARGTEKLVILAESRTTGAEAQGRLRRAINNRAIDLLGAPADDAVIVPPHTLPKTSSGKIRRSSCRELYLTRQLDAPQRAVWLQLARLMLAGLKLQRGRIGQHLRDVGYAAYLWVLVLLLAPPVWLGCVLIPHRPSCWRIARSASRLLAWLGRVPVQVEGAEQNAHGPRAILVANHASYLDGLMMLIALPEPCRFVAKAELLKNPFTRLFLHRLGCEFVERFEPQQGVADAERLSAEAKGDQALFYFPEGGLVRTPGLRPFHLGAFTAAAAAGLLVVPIALCGTRSILRCNSLFPRRGRVVIRFGAPIEPAGADWQAAVALRDRARAWILQQLDEPDLAERA